MPNGDEKYYLFSDNIQDDRFKGLSSGDLMDIDICNNLHYDGTKEEGVMFHLIGVLSQFGKGVLFVLPPLPKRAKYFYHQTIQVLKATCC